MEDCCRNYGKNHNGLQHHGSNENEFIPTAVVPGIKRRPDHLPGFCCRYNLKNPKCQPEKTGKYVKTILFRVLHNPPPLKIIRTNPYDPLFKNRYITTYAYAQYVPVLKKSLIMNPDYAHGFSLSGLRMSARIICSSRYHFPSLARRSLMGLGESAPPEVTYRVARPSF